MPGEGPVRLGGVVGVAAGAAMYAAGIADLLLTSPGARWPGPVVLASFSDYLVQALLVVGLAGTLAAVAGILLRASRRRARGMGRRWLWVVGSSAAFLGHALLLISALAALVRGAAAGGPPPFLAVGYLLALVGAVVLGTAAVLDGRVLPRCCALLLVLGYALTALPWGSWAGEWTMLGAAWASVGYALIPKGGIGPARAVPRAWHGRERAEVGRGPFGRPDPPARPRARGGAGGRPRRRARRA